jgi:hypothetical protein
MATQIQYSRLQARTLELLKNRPISLTLKKLSEETGLPEGWLHSIIKFPMMSSSAHRIEVLFNYLNGKPLDI